MRFVHDIELVVAEFGKAKEVKTGQFGKGEEFNYVISLQTNFSGG